MVVGIPDARPGERLHEGGPPGPGVELVRGGEERFARHDVDGDPLPVVVPVGVPEGRFGTALLGYLVLDGGKALLQVLVRFRLPESLSGRAEELRFVYRSFRHVAVSARVLHEVLLVVGLCREEVPERGHFERERLLVFLRKRFDALPDFGKILRGCVVDPAAVLHPFVVSLPVLRRRVDRAVEDLKQES